MLAKKGRRTAAKRQPVCVASSSIALPMPETNRAIRSEDLLCFLRGVGRIDTLSKRIEKRLIIFRRVELGVQKKGKCLRASVNAL